MAKILVVEDDVELADRLQDWFSLENHTVDIVNHGDDALQMLRAFSFDVIVLDWDLPGKTGIEICQTYRREGGMTPILFLTGKGDVDHRLTGLDSGGDDYLPKPFDVRELSARVKALIRRPSDMVANLCSIGKVHLNPGSRTVTVEGKTAQLMRKECAVLEFLMRHPNRHYGAKQILESVWPSDSEASEETVRTCVKTLRKQLSSLGKTEFLKTQLGSGYYVDPTGAE